MEDNCSSQKPATAEHGDILKAPSAKAKLNKILLERVQATLQNNPEVDLYREFLQICKATVFEQKQPRVASALAKRNLQGKPRKPANFCADLVARARTAEIVHPLSDETTKFLSQYMRPDSNSEDLDQSLVHVLSQMILSCERLWEFPTRGVVLKCNATIAAKIIRGNDDYTEYTVMNYLAEHAPDIPAPKPHGLVKFHNVRILFMTYFPSMTLESAWPKLTHEDKVSIQKQLDDIFIKLRSLPWNGHSLGGPGGEGVKDDHQLSHRSGEAISTVAQFEDFQFSIPIVGDSSWPRFLRSLLPPSPANPIFTHGDVRPANIMVDITESGKYIVTGIIDWEDGGFYPEYFESAKILYLFTKTDWWEYLPACIAPARNPERWLVGQLWDQCVNQLRSDGDIHDSDGSE